MIFPRRNPQPSSTNNNICNLPPLLSRKVTLSLSKRRRKKIEEKPSKALCCTLQFGAFFHCPEAGSIPPSPIFSFILPSGKGTVVSRKKRKEPENRDARSLPPVSHSPDRNRTRGKETEKDQLAFVLLILSF